MSKAENKSKQRRREISPLSQESKEGGRYYPCHRRIKKNYIFSKVKFPYVKRTKIRLRKSLEKREAENFFQNFKNKREITYKHIGF